ncbi:MAG: hypothetical protein RIT27_256 [Pseudomonadota bacterium]
MTIKQLISQWRLFSKKMPPNLALEKTFQHFQNDILSLNIFEQFLEQLAQEADFLTYFTPLPLVNILIGLLQPQHGQTFYLTNIESGNFLIAANDYANAVQTEESTPISNPLQLYAHASNPLSELAFKLANLDQVHFSEQIPLETDFIVGNFLEHWDSIPFEQFHGKIALIIPDEWLFEHKTKIQRKDVLNYFNVQFILRLPEGTFHGKDCSANILFLESHATSQHIWFYDLRTGISWLENNRQLSVHLSPFTTIYDNPTKFKEKDQRLKQVFAHELQTDWDYWWLDENDFINKPIPSTQRFFQDALNDLYSLNNLLKV